MTSPKITILPLSIALKVFLDAGAFLALADEDDQYHSAATPVYTELLQTKAQLLPPISFSPRPTH